MITVTAPVTATAPIPKKVLHAKLTQQQLEAHLWGAANILRGKTRTKIVTTIARS